MIKGQPFINLEQHVDLKGFDLLHPEICRGIATAESLAYQGLQTYHPDTVHHHALNIKVNPLAEAYLHWKDLPDADPIKIAGENLTYNQLTKYLKLALGAYDLYSVYKILDIDFQNNGLGETASHFPNLIKWIFNFQSSGIFKSLYSANLLALEAGGIPWSIEILIFL